MRTILLHLLGASVVLSSGFSAETKEAPAPQQQTIAGAGSYGAINLDAIEGAGQVKLNGTQVEKLHLMGSLIANGAQIGSIDISGEANFSDSVVKSGVNIIGYLRAQRTTFDQPIFVTLQKAVFTTSRLKGVTVRQNVGFKGKQVLELRQNTVIDGPVSFEGGKGEIHLYSGSKVLGDVKGAKIIQK